VQLFLLAWNKEESGAGLIEVNSVYMIKIERHHVMSIFTLLTDAAGGWG
jgi:hypothetical protein